MNMNFKIAIFVHFIIGVLLFTVLILAIGFTPACKIDYQSSKLMCNNGKIVSFYDLPDFASRDLFRLDYMLENNILVTGFQSYCDGYSSDVSKENESINYKVSKICRDGDYGASQAQAVKIVLILFVIYFPIPYLLGFIVWIFLKKKQ